MGRVLRALMVAAAILLLAPAARAETRPDLMLGAGDRLAVAFDQPQGIVTCPAVPVVVTDGPVSLGGAALDIATTTPPGAGFGCLLIDNRGPDPVVGTFAGLPEGTILGPPDARFRITYTAGDGNDVLLKRVEVPTRIGFSGVPIHLGGWYSDYPSTLHVYVGGDTPTALAAPGTVTVTFDGTMLGTFPLEYSSVAVSLGVLPVGDHVFDVSYGGGSYRGDLVFLPATASHRVTIRPPRPAPPIFGPNGEPMPGGIMWPPAAAPPPPPAVTAPAANPTPSGEPTSRAIRAALRRVDGARLSPRRIRFVQTFAAPGTVRWRVLARTPGGERPLTASTRKVTNGRVKARLPLGRRARELLRRAPEAGLVLKTTLATRAGREITARARLR